jgi:hypothetical protein
MKAAVVVVVVVVVELLEDRRFAKINGVLALHIIVLMKRKLIV